MAYPNPLSTRIVKDHLYNAAADMGMIGATALVQGLMGSAWGWLFKRNNNRAYLNFIGELANRTVSKDVKRIATNVYAANQPVFYDQNGRQNYYLPNASDNYGNYVDDNRHILDRQFPNQMVPYGTDISNRLGYKFRSPFIQSRNENSNNGRKKKDKNKKKNRDHSECLLETTINFMSQKGYDFNEGDFSLKDVLYKLKMKLMSIMPMSESKKDEYAKNVLKACYEFLEENGEDAYPIMVNAIESSSKTGNFSEQEIPETSMTLFFECADSYSKLTTLQKLYVKDCLSQKYGSEVTDEFLYSINKYQSSGVPPTKRKLKVFNVIAIISAVFVAIKMIKDYLDRDKDKQNDPNRIN